MKQRLITAAVGLALLLVVLFFFNTWIFNIAVAFIIGLAVFELLQSTGILSNRTLSAAVLLFSVLVPFFRTPGFNLLGKLAVPVYLLVLFVILLRCHETMKTEHLCVAFTVSVLVPFSFSCLIYLRNQFERDGLFYVLLVFAGAWFADAGGYFVGRLCGKHKLSPKISPNKTIEGAVGGVLFNIVFYLLLGFGYWFYQKQTGQAVEVRYILLGLFGAAAAAISILGDLSASAVKRQYGLKDFGSIFPGHGGVMDRFDSVLFVAPFLYAALQLLTLIR